VEVADVAVDREQIQGPQRPDLVDAAGKSAAAEHERGLVAPRAAAALERRGPAHAPGDHPGAGPPPRTRLRLAPRFQLDNLAHRSTLYGGVLKNRLPKVAIWLCGLSLVAGCPGVPAASAATGLPELQADLANQVELVGPR